MRQTSAWGKKCFQLWFSDVTRDFFPYFGRENIHNLYKSAWLNISLPIVGMFWNFDTLTPKSRKDHVALINWGRGWGIHGIMHNLISFNYSNSFIALESRKVSPNSPPPNTHTSKSPIKTFNYSPKSYFRNSLHPINFTV